MAGKEKKVKGKNDNNALLIDRLSSYKWIKFSQSLVLIMMGVLFISMNSVPEFTNFITIGFAVTLLIYSILEIFSAIIIKKSILSTEIFVSLMIFSFALMALCIPELRELSFLTWFFGILIIGYSLILITSGILAITIDANDEKYGTSKFKRLSVAVVEFVGAGVLIALDICLWIFGPRTPNLNPEENKIVLIAILIGVALVFMGIASMFYAFQAIKTEKILKKQEANAQNADALYQEGSTPQPNPYPENSDSSIITVDAQDIAVRNEDSKQENEESQASAEEVKQIEDDESKKSKKK